MRLAPMPARTARDAARLPSETDALKQILEMRIRVEGREPVVCRNPSQFAIVRLVSFFEPDQHLVLFTEPHMDRGDANRCDILLRRKAFQPAQSLLRLSPFS